MLAIADIRALPIPAASIDMIFTDPPYVKAQFECYHWLADEAARVLKPGGFVAAMAGTVGINRIYRWFDDAGLTFYHDFIIGMGGSETGIVWKHAGGKAMPITMRVKHIVVYSHGPALQRVAMAGLYWAGGSDKMYHHWGQSVDSHRYYIDCLSAPGDLVLDPFCGGGTTGIACAVIGRRCLQFDLDPAAVATTKLRMTGESYPLHDMPLFSKEMLL